MYFNTETDQFSASLGKLVEWDFISSFQQYLSCLKRNSSKTIDDGDEITFFSINNVLRSLTLWLFWKDFFLLIPKNFNMHALK